MAVFPQGMSSVEARCRANPGELRTFRALQDELRLLYVGMTRARHALALSAHGASAITERVRTALDAMQGDFQDGAT